MFDIEKYESELLTFGRGEAMTNKTSGRNYPAEAPSDPDDAACPESHRDNKVNENLSKDELC